MIRPLVIVGPTASGKTALSLELAEHTGGEIINLDSMQMYLGMDIGTAKLPVSERRGIPHHLFDVLDVTTTASVARYQEMAVEAAEEIMARGVRPIFVGGSMLYYQALIDDFAFPPTDPAVRTRYQARLEEIGVDVLHAELAQVDPAAAEIIEDKDPRRTVRALEVIELTGKPFAASQPPKDAPPRWNAQVIGLATDAEWLNPRIEQRTIEMFDSGFVEEVRELVDKRGLVAESTAGRAIGYAQVLQVLAGEMSEAEAREKTTTGTRRYVRRQRSWFKRDPRITWIDASGDVSAQAVTALR